MSRKELGSTNVRIGDQAVKTHTDVGCVSGRDEDGFDTVAVIVDCPSDQSQRCARCILNLAGGEEAISSMKRSFGHVSTS
jgi:hypothetical protein